MSQNKLCLYYHYIVNITATQNSYDWLYHIDRAAGCPGQQNFGRVECFVNVYYVSDYLLEGEDMFRIA